MVKFSDNVDRALKIRRDKMDALNLFLQSMGGNTSAPDLTPQVLYEPDKYETEGWLFLECFVSDARQPGTSDEDWDHHLQQGYRMACGFIADAYAIFGQIGLQVRAIPVTTDDGRVVQEIWVEKPKNVLHMMNKQAQNAVPEGFEFREKFTNRVWRLAVTYAISTISRIRGDGNG